MQAPAAVNADPQEISELEAVVADLERQIAEQHRVLAGLRAPGRPTWAAAKVMIELNQKADRQRDALRILRERITVVPH